MDKVTKFLSENEVCTVATCKDNNPRASALEYVMVDGSMIFITGRDSIKAGNLRAINKISIFVHNMPLFVALDGTTTTATEDEIASYNKVLFERHPEFKEYIEKGMMPPFAHYKVIVSKAYYNDYSAGMSPTEIIEYE